MLPVTVAPRQARWGAGRLFSPPSTLISSATCRMTGSAAVRHLRPPNLLGLGSSRKPLFDGSPDTLHTLARAALRTGRPTPLAVDHARRGLELAHPPTVEQLTTCVDLMLVLGQAAEAQAVIQQHAAALKNPAALDALQERLNRQTK